MAITAITIENFKGIREPVRVELKPITLLLTAGQRHEATAFEALMTNGAVKRPGRGRPKIRPQRIAGDKGYCGAPIRHFLRRRGIRFTIAKKRNMCRKGPFDKEIYRQRNRVERLFNRFKQNRRLATRYEKRATNYLAMWQIAAILMWYSLHTGPSYLDLFKDIQAASAKNKINNTGIKTR